jgi:ribonuclease P protein component
MLPAQNRLTHRSAFAKVYGKGRSSVTDLIVVYVLPEGNGPTRVGFSVSGKLGSAVVRNRMKRVLSECTRAILPRIADGFNVVVVARRKAVGASYADVSAALEATFSRIGILKARDD